MSANILIEPHYWGCADFYKVLLKAENVTIDLHSNYQKGSYRNRCNIMSPNRILSLSVPLERGKHQHSIFEEVRISYSENWQKDHWQSLVSSYRRSAYFEFFEDDLAPLYEEKFEFLKDLNLATIRHTLKMLRISKELSYTEKFIPFETFEGKDWRDKIHPNPKKNKIESDWNSYQQVFMDRAEFKPNLSILDVLFNLGPRTLNYLLED